MKSLHDEVRERRAAGSALATATVEASGPALVIRPWQGEYWVLPWSQFVAARLDPHGGGRRLELGFANYRVIATGENLASLLDDLAAQRVACLRALPDSYRVQSAEGAPFLSAVEVQPVGGAAEIQGSPG